MSIYYRENIMGNFGQEMNMTKFIKNHITINAIVLVSEQCFSVHKHLLSPSSFVQEPSIKVIIFNF